MNPTASADPHASPPSTRNSFPPYRVIGYLNGSFGLAIAGRNTLAALAASGRDAGPVDFQAGGRSGDGASEPLHGRTINVFHANPLEVVQHAPVWRSRTSWRDWNACVPFWELPLLPRQWHRILSAMDLVLAPTHFVRDACLRRLPEERVMHYPQAAFLGAPPAPARRRWGIDEGVTAFLVSFDVGSDIERKNPWAAVQAFRNAFAGNEPVRLLVKMRPWPHVPAYVAAARELRDLAAADRRISFIEADLGHAAVMELYASCDVMVSLHRSEGLGLHLMEAMSLSRAVVATDWSGSKDFVHRGNAVPIGYRLVPVRPSHAAYLSEIGRPGQVWAEPDAEEAVAALRMLHANPARRAELGVEAAKDMARRREMVLAGAPFQELESRLARNGRHWYPALAFAVRTRRGFLHARNLASGAARRIAPR